METTTTPLTSPARRLAINALAVVGFIVLIISGMGLAIYAATFVPKVAGGLGSAAVYLSSVFVPQETPAGLEVVTAGTSVPFATPTPLSDTATTTVFAPSPVPATLPAGLRAGGTTSTTYKAGTGTTSAQTLFGLPDLTVTSLVTGYLTSADTASFIKSSTVPSGLRGAVKFTITNIGTNASGRFDFIATLPTSRSYTFTSDPQDSLLPGERIDYILGFDRTSSGTKQTISVLVDSNNAVAESNNSNNSASATVDIK